MIEDYVHKLIENLPKNITNCKEPIHMDLVLDGGIFNGSYLVGCLYFLKEMEKRGFIQIDRISGCSVGSITAFLYFIDALDMAFEIYTTIFDNFKKNHTISCILGLKEMIQERIPKNICDQIKNRLFITYYHLKKKQKIVKQTYKSVDNIIDSLIKSSFVPFIINGNMMYKNKFIDGINPYIFPIISQKKILYLDLFGYDKIGCLLNVRNEKTNYHRILSGLLDIHTFFIKQSNTQMCSYINDWNLFNYLHQFIKMRFENICIYTIYSIFYLQNIFPELYWKETFFCKLSQKIIYELYIFSIDNYCL